MSSGKVKCTCGWSWNKSDSSKKDMYICHECGRDNSNNMKNGGWLDSYADGGTMQEHQENYNDASVSLPEGFVGMSNDTSGRNYSPAWGGQFAEGGEIDPTKKPIDPPATRADSLAVYNNSMKVDSYYNSRNYKNDQVNYFQNPDAHRQNDDEFKSFKNDPTASVPSKTNTLILQAKLPNNIYRKDIDKNKYLQRELSNTILDTRAPMQLFDRRITPTSYKSFLNTNKNDIMKGDAVSLLGYDPISVKPFDLLTEKEKKLRIERYGTDGVPKSYLDKTKPTTKPTTKPIYKDKPKDRKPITQVVNNLKPAGLVSDDLEIDSTNFPELRPQVRPVKDWRYIWKHATSTEWGHVNSPEDMDHWVDWRDWYSTGGGKDKGDSVTITPEYQMGGYVYPVNYVPQSQNGGPIKPSQKDYKTKGEYNAALKSYNVNLHKYELANNPERLKGESAKDYETRTKYFNFKIRQEQDKDPITKSYLEMKDDQETATNPIAKTLRQVFTSPAHVAHGIYNAANPKGLDKYKSRATKNDEDLDLVNSSLDAASLLVPFDSGMKADALWKQALIRTAKEVVEDGVFNTAKKANQWLLSNFQGGGSIPGAVGFSYARTNDPAPSEGPYAKKTMASAKNGDVIVSDRGQWDYPGEVTEINSNEITMKPDPLTGKKLTRPLLGISDTGDVKIMKPGKDYKFKGTKVTEYPIAQEGENIPGGKNIKVKYPSGDIKTVNTGSPEYVDMYKTGKIQTPEGMANDTYWGGELDDVKVKGKLSPLAKARAEYDKKHGRDAFINQKKDEYIKGLGESNWFGTDRTNFPETVLRDINANYDYDRNTSALEKIAKQRGFDLNKRDNWIHNLTPGEREALINSKYSAQLNPNEFAESLSGLQQIGNTLLPGNPLNFSIAGLTPQEEEEDRNAKLSAFKVFSPLNLPGNAAANYLKNTNMSSYEDFRETPTLGMQRMGNVSPMESMAFNPLTYEALPALTKLVVKAPGAIADIPQNISKISETVSEVAPKVKQFGKDVRKNVGETYDRIKYLQDIKTNKTGELTNLTNNIDNVRTSYDSTPVEWMPRDIGELGSYIDNIKFNYRSALDNIMEPNAATQQSLEIMNKAFRSPVGQRIEEVISGVGQPSTLEEVHGLIRDFANSLPEGTTFTKTIKNNITRAQKETIYNKRKDAAALKDFVKSIGKKKIPEQPLEYSQKEKETIAAIRELGKYKQVMQWQGSKVMSDPEALVNINKEILKLDDAVVQKLLGVTKQELLEKYKNVVPATKKTQSDITTNPLGVNDLTEVDDFGQPSLLESKLAPPQGRESLVKKIGRSYAESFGENPIDYQDPIRRPESLIGMAKTDYNYVQKPILNADGYPAGTGWHPEKLEAAGRTREQLMRALKKVEASPKDTNFIGSGSLSTDSYPLTLDAGTLMMKKGIVDVNVQKGVSSLNDMGYTNSMPKLVLKDINSKIEELEKLSGKKLPRAKYNPANKQYEVPQIYFTRLKQGGSINKADENSLVKLDQLTNFTNYNTKQPGGWLDNYN